MSSERKRRARTTRPAVRVADRVARSVIRIGGAGTIAAVSTVFLFLLWVVWPLLRSETLSEPRPLTTVPAGEQILAAGIDDTLSTIWAWTDADRFVAMAASDGTPLAELRPFDQKPQSFSFPMRSAQGIFGFADGSVRLVRIETRTDYRDMDQLPQELRSRAAGDRFLLEGKVAERVGVDQFALRSIGWTVGEALPISAGAAIALVDLSITSDGPAIASIDSNGVLRVSRVSTTTNFMTGEDEVSTESGELALVAVAVRGLPHWVLLRGLGDNALAVWPDGHAVRVDVRDIARPAVVEELDLLPDASATVTAAAFLTGKSTLVIGDSSGALHAWFRVPAPAMGTGDGARFLHAHDLPRSSSGSVVTALSASPRTRLIAAGHADGSIRVLQATAGRLVASAQLGTGSPVSALAMSPDDRSVLAWNGALSVLGLDAPHPEVSVRTLLQPVLYEGYARPEHVWQSSSGSDDFEPKLGLWPLIFGTLKATLYSMLVGVPIALMAAIYTSEFLRPEVKSVVKPAIEMMASLPSVVLGFLAALILAPLVEQSVTEVLAAVVLIPLSLLTCAHLWQLLPSSRRTALQNIRFVLAAAAILLGVAAATALGPFFERTLYGGDIHAWLDGRGGGPTGGWLLVTLPASALLVAWLGARVTASFHGGPVALRALAGFLAGCVVAGAIALGSAWLLGAAGFDLRGGLVGTYVQRNAMVVGFVMAFAIIPIIYTIAEDALSSIPENLRAGSLALGATPWQTAVRIVIPTAMSGLFSAIMVGLGRAVGETMVVLMAAGNTPVLDWNIFNGFRTLSANIAVELPEAVRNGTHYRTLFLAALTLFVMTFVLNTAAELVRLRFRRRARQL